MAPVQINDLILLSKSKVIYKVVLINYINNTVTLKPVHGDLVQFGHFSIKFTDLKNCSILGNTRLNPTLDILYG